MKRNVSFLFLLFFFLSTMPGFAKVRFSHVMEPTDTVTGTVRSLDRNTIDIEDEFTRTVKRYVYMEHPSPVHPGDRVRADYDRENSHIRSIRKMTAVPYLKDGQNLGNVIKN